MATYYVSTTGSNANDGSESSPFATINHAVSSGLQPGDTVLVKPGTYRESVYVNIDGSAAGDITIRSETPGAASIQPGSSGNGFTIEGSYITIDGFEITGSAYHGIEAQNSHHISMLNNISHDNGASGLSAIWGEFYLIEGNTTYGNAASDWFSGISVYENRNITGDTETTGYRTIIRNNVSYDNVTENGQHTDGNGIIIDDFQSTQNSAFPSYTYPTLVENNLVYENGGKGIQVIWSDNVTVRGNTAYHNNQDLQNTGTWRGEISNSQSSNNTFVNNIAVVDPSVHPENTAIDNNSYGGYTNDNVVWANNLTYTGTAGEASVKTDGGNAMPSAADGNLLGVDPGFIDPGNDFRLSSGSVAIDAGTDDYGLASVDLEGTARVEGVVDIGAYERDSSGTPTPPANTAPEATNDSGFSTTEDTAATIATADLRANDSDADGDALTVTSVSGAVNGTVSLASASSVVFTPDAGYSGMASFDYTVSDGAGGTDTATVSIEVTAASAPPSNTAPVATDDSGFATSEDTALSLKPSMLKDNDTDADGDSLTITNVSGAVNGTVSLAADETVVFTPDAGFTGMARFDYTISDGAGGTDTAQAEIQVSTAEVTPPAPPEDDEEAGSFSIWDSSATPDIMADSDTAAVTLGLRFTADVDAALEALRLYVSEANTGTQSINLWSDSGTRLGQATAEVTESGWSTVSFDKPLQLEAGEDYIASYYAPNGGYVVSEDYFDSASDEGPISLEANSGVYSYGSGGSSFPDQSYAFSNYWVDVVLTPDTATDVAGDNVIGETGTVVAGQAGAGDWTSVTFDTPLEDPSVVMGGLTGNGANPYTVRVRNVTDTGFEYQIDEYEYLDDWHTTEEISWLAVEKGTHVLSDGRTISAGDASVGGSFAGISFDDGAFDSAPVVLGQAVGEANAMAVTDRLRSVSETGFEARLFQQEAATGSIEAEGFDWIAVGQGGSATDGALAGTSGNMVDHRPTTVDFDGSFSGEDFVMVTDMQTTNGWDVATLQTASLDDESMVLRVLEETSRDGEVRHVDEDAGFVGFETGLIEGTPFESDTVL
ncbi:cadherin-like domain-containing protein [Salipiger mucosus]|nr:cadherin-like domain-containing protein [Salipiger mucosus]